ncbi:hypothetical protein BFP70_12155 [Thioclava sp. SK-1]|uniref:hypothetical protein n=1 Tax=Thioclava sp. SK-1 TaxID=1889770 RepID=UPI0008244575|nr:hypothetical protein [Thioclava sp. SK-1]OCX63400.1 hypothetical protein BFP70_12155 [Thioclava sp. SK-1]
MKTKDDAAIEQVVDILRQERAAIRDADFPKMAILIARKEAAIEGIRSLPLIKIRHIKEMSLANQRLLEAALKGIRAAQSRLSVIQQTARSFQSYDAMGRGQKISGQSGSVEKRA